MRFFLNTLLCNKSIVIQFAIVGTVEEIVPGILVVCAVMGMGTVVMRGTGVGLTPLVAVQTTAEGGLMLLLGTGGGGVSQTTGAGGGSATTAVTVGAGMVAIAALWFRSTRGGCGVTSPLDNEFTATHTQSLSYDHFMGWTVQRIWVCIKFSPLYLLQK